MNGSSAQPGWKSLSLRSKVKNQRDINRQVCLLELFLFLPTVPGLIIRPLNTEISSILSSVLRVGPTVTLRAQKHAAALICIVMKHISVFHPAASTNAAHQHTSKVVLPVCFTVCTIRSASDPHSYTSSNVQMCLTSCNIFRPHI